MLSVNIYSHGRWEFYRGEQLRSQDIYTIVLQRDIPGLKDQAAGGVLCLGERTLHKIYHSMYAGVSPPNREQSQGIELLLYEIYMVF
jgi:hypothetical protein